MPEGRRAGGAAARMNRLFRFLTGAASLALTFMLIAAVGIVLMTGTGSGRQFLRGQTERVAASLLGAGYVAELGRQSVGLGAGGTFEITWTDIRLKEGGSSRPASKVARLTVGLRPLDLMAGRLSIRSLAVVGATIDLTRGDDDPAARPQAREVPDSALPSSALLPRAADALLERLDRRLAALGQSGIERVDLSDITVVAPVAPGGGPFVSRVEHAGLDLGDLQAMRFSATLGVDRLRLAASGDARYDDARKRLTFLDMSVGPLDLGSVVPPGDPQNRLDGRPFASNAKVSARLGLAAEAGTGPREMSLILGIGAGAIQVGKGHTRVEAASLAFAYREGADEAVLRPSLLVFEGVSMQLGGRVRALARGGAAGRDLAFRIEAEDIRSTVGRRTKAEEASVARIALDGGISLSPLSIALSTLAVETPSGRIDGAAEFGLGTPEARTTLRLSSAGLAAADVKAFWPFNLAPNTRRWVLEHIRDEGVARNVAVTLDLTRKRLAEVVKPKRYPAPGEFRLAFDFDGLDLATVGELPELRSVSGRLETLGGDTTVRFDAARVAGLETIAASPSTAVFTRSIKGSLHDIDLTLSIGLAGGLAEVLAVADRPPIQALRGLDVKPQDASGRASVAADMAFVLGDEVPKGKELQSYAVDVELAEAGLAAPFEGRRLSDLSGPLSIVQGAAEGELKGAIDGIPATIRFGQPFGPTPAVDPRLEIEAVLDGDGAARLAPALAGIVDGPMAATLRRRQDGGEGFAASVDLKDAAVALPIVGWRKGRGVPAVLAFDIVRAGEGTELANLTLRGNGFSAAGSVLTDARGLRSAKLADVAFNPGDKVDLDVQRVTNGYSIALSGERFDARPFLNDLKATLGERAAKGPPKAPGQLDVAVSIDRLAGFGGEELRGVSLNFAGGEGVVAALSIAGTDGGGGPFSVDLSPRGRDRSIKVRARNAGRLADFAGLYGRMEGGALALTLLGSSAAGYSGDLVAEDFTLVDEPRLSSLVGSSSSTASASLSQAIGTPLRTERAVFDHASAGIDYGKEGLRVRDGIIRGPVFGSSFSGTVYDSANRIDIVGSFMPAYGLNGMFGKIPLVGQILGNGNEGGLIGITYRLEGAFDSPTLTVNPISAIAPGIFRSIFAYGP